MIIIIPLIPNKFLKWSLAIQEMLGTDNNFVEFIVIVQA